MSDERAMRARVAGRKAVERRTVWQLEIGGGLRFRCVATPGRYVVQVRTLLGWTDEIASGSDPAALLRTATRLPTTARAVAEAATDASR